MRSLKAEGSLSQPENPSTLVTEARYSANPKKRNSTTAPLAAMSA
jgi:hypothetical protein